MKAALWGFLGGLVATALFTVGYSFAQEQRPQALAVEGGHSEASPNCRVYMWPARLRSDGQCWSDEAVTKIVNGQVYCSRIQIDCY